MPLEYTPVSKLNSSKQEWKIRVLMSRAWTFHPQDKPDFILGMEVILVDEQGDRIQASVKTKLVKKFKNQLKEGEFRDIMNFEVLENNGDYRGTTHPFKIAFLFNTYLKPCDHIPNISRFSFCSFGEIESQSNTDDVFIDILGEVVAMSGVKEKNVANNPSKLLEIQLRDLNDTVIECTLWGKHADDVHSYVKSNSNGPIIFLGSLMRTKKYNGKASVQNSRFSTKLFFNEEIEEIALFKSKISEPPAFTKSSHRHAALTTGTCSAASSDSTQTAPNRKFLKPPRDKDIEKEKREDRYLAFPIGVQGDPQTQKKPTPLIPLTA